MGWRRPYPHAFVVLLSAALVSGCSLKIFSPPAKAVSTTIQGKVLPLVSQLAVNVLPGVPLLPTAHASGCSDPQAALYELSPDGAHALLHSGVVGADGTFRFELTAEEFQKVGPDLPVRWFIQATCGTQSFSRLVHSASDDITAGSAAFALLVQSGSAPVTALRSLRQDQLASLMTSIEAATSAHRASTDLGTVIDLILQSPTVLEKFQSLLGFSAETLQDTSPRLVTMDLGDGPVDSILLHSATEPEDLEVVDGTTTSFVALASHPLAGHPSRGYDLAYEWRLNGVAASQTASFAHSWPVNSFGIVELELLVGQSNGSGAVDEAKPHLRRQRSVMVRDLTAPETPSGITLAVPAASPHPSSTPSFLVTGTTTGDTISIFSDSSCSDGSLLATGTATGSSVVLQSAALTSDGAYSIHARAMDESGNFSGCSGANAQYVRDTTPPTLQWTTPTAGQFLGAGTSVSLAWSASDSEVEGISNPPSISIDATSNGGESFSSLATGLSNTPGLNSGSTTWSVPVGSARTQRLRMTATDAAGNTATLTGGEFFINHPPTLDSLSDLTIDEDAPANVPLTGISPGASGESDTLTLTAISSNPSIVPNPSITYSNPDGTGSLLITPSSQSSGTADITVTIDDGRSASSTLSRTFRVTVTPVNDAPTLASIADVTIPEDSAPQTVSLSGISSGAANESNTLTVTATSSNTALIPNPSVSYTSPNTTGSLSFTPAPNANGTATITVTVHDGQPVNPTFTRTFAVNVAPRQ